MRRTALAVLLFAAPAMAQEAAAPPPADPAVQLAPAVTNPPMSGPRLLVSTALGDITVQLDAAHAPASVANVLRYAREKHYDGTVFYRVAKGFVIQMGSWEAHQKGRGIHKGPVPLEANNGLHNLRGTVALARAEAPDSATAEFFFNLSDNLVLDHAAADPGNSTGYAVFGQVVAGMDVVDNIAQGAVGDDGPMPGQAPLDPVLIRKVSVLK